MCAKEVVVHVLIGIMETVFNIILYSEDDIVVLEPEFDSYDDAFNYLTDISESLMEDYSEYKINIQKFTWDRFNIPQ